jgi:hypothetical protein
MVVVRTDNSSLTVGIKYMFEKLARPLTEAGGKIGA